ncbi:MULTISPECIES: MFS transporter [Alcaligenes]|jgi:metabolite-proton symporter|uniref:MFS transporter n=2 Tax=Alcaligenes TaxID=507 RepID=A0A3G2HY49_9BURK|nr:MULTISPECIES: MFS transporter [Alcaligenes]ASR90447.1 MFS transporter [Alcaligenes faecalis]AWG35214.1 MFS transporter [Alcaligenes aquatilis]AYN21678.1 MFS transporter [Alcaligenes aquatilis]MCC9161824.1 MHS family MFS transporter [Alcaligenes sp. MMA]MCH4225668.1 MHS family MFS transporter [Alcaligenes faecalis]
MTANVTPPAQRASAKRVLLASLTGSSIEWFDYFLYGTTAALVFNKLFFPTFDPVVGLMLAYLSFALTFFIRPLGGLIFAHIGDRIGRKKTLVITLSMMGGATVLIGLLPGYDTIGVWAPILLVLLRLIQGLGIGGEWGGALLLAYEYAAPNRRGLFGSVPQMGVTIGMLLATLAMTLMSLLPDEQFMSWGWRIPFLASAGLVFLGLWVRNGIDETPDFQKAKQEGQVAKMPLVETLRDHWREVLIAIGAKIVETAPFYLFSTFVVSYATSSTLQYERFDVLNAVTVATLVTTFCIPLMGLLSDYIGRVKVFIAGAVAMALFAVPYFLLLDQRSTTSLMIATVVALGLIWAPITAVLGTMFSEIFATRVRYTGITLGYQIGAALAGGTAPLIATWLMSRYDGSWVPVAVYIIVAALISIAAVSAVRVRKPE